MTKWYHIGMRRAILFFSLLVIFVLGPYLFYNINFMGKIFPNIYVSGIDIGGLTQNDAISKLSENIAIPSKINFISNDKMFSLAASEIELNYNYKESIERAYNMVRTGNFFLDSMERVKLLVNPVKLGVLTNFNEDSVNSFVSTIKKDVVKNPVYPSINVNEGQIQIENGTTGTAIDLDKLRILIGSALSFNTTGDITIPITQIDPSLTGIEIEALRARAEKYLNKTLTLKFEYNTYSYKNNDLIRFLDPKKGYEDDNIKNVGYKIAKEINRDPQNPKFEFSGNHVHQFQPALDGVSLDTKTFNDLLALNLDNLAESKDTEVSFDIPVIKVKPDVRTDEINTFGIKELIGHGDSTYFHSIPGRVFNVNLAASRINGTLVAPGETFSFTKTLGDVSKFTGYQQAYIISGGKTILGDGGGVCQVSTTLFRAVLNAGLPVEERSGHAYRVGYYEQNSPPGMDATVYSPKPDFKFTNDTAHHILIVVKNNPEKFALTFDLYGTSDGREATITKPILSNYKAPLATIYQDDPTLPAGILKQTDFAAAGARVSFDYSVTKDGQEMYKKTFVTNYQPWAAIYLRGTKT